MIQLQAKLLLEILSEVTRSGYSREGNKSSWGIGSNGTIKALKELQP